MRAQVLSARRVATTLALLTPLTGCSSAPAAAPRPTTGASPSSDAAAADPWSRLAARVAAAADKRYTAGYRLARPGQSSRTVNVVVATDASWLVTMAAAAGDGSVDVALARTGDGLYQCTVNTANPDCVRVAGSDGQLPANADPGIEHVFTDWLTLMADRQAPLSVDSATPPAGATGDCFSVEPSTASLTPAMQGGVYCYQPDGTLTAAALGTATLTLISPPAPAPTSITLPAPVVAGVAVPVTPLAPTPSSS